MNASSTPPSTLSRELGTFDAVIVGLGSMIGAGVFAAFGPAAEVAGNALSVARCSVWLYDEVHSKIRCIDLYDYQKNAHTDGAELLRASRPSASARAESEVLEAIINAPADASRVLPWLREDDFEEAS